MSGAVGGFTRMVFGANGPPLHLRPGPIPYALSSGSCSSARAFDPPLLSDPASRRRPCASLALHLHQVGQGTCTPKLSDMFGTPKKAQTGRPAPLFRLYNSLLSSASPPSSLPAR